MNEERLTQALRALADETSGFGPPPALEARLRAQVRARKPERARGAAAWWWGIAAAAAVLIVVADGRRPPAAAPAEQTTPWFYSTGMPDPDAASMLRVELPPRAASEFGVVVSPAARSVKADIVVGDDGLTRAIRFVRE